LVLVLVAMRPQCSALELQIFLGIGSSGSRVHTSNVKAKFFSKVHLPGASIRFSCPGRLLHCARSPTPETGRHLSTPDFERLRRFRVLLFPSSCHRRVTSWLSSVSAVARSHRMYAKRNYSPRSLRE